MANSFHKTLAPGKEERRIYLATAQRAILTNFLPLKLPAIFSQELQKKRVV